MQDENFRRFHRYSRLVRRGFVPPLTHEVDGGTMHTEFGDDDDVVLVCNFCGSKITPGINLIERVDKANKEFHGD